YVDAVTTGIDEMPTISDAVRSNVAELLEKEGADGLLARLRISDPDYYDVVDRKNIKRVAHALEIIYESGQTYTSFRTGRTKTRNFRILKFAIDMPREVLFDRIARRVDAMVAGGLEEEIRGVERLRGLNSLNTVGVKEMLDHIDGKFTLEEAMEKIARNTRVFAKKQLTWLKKDPDVIRCKDAKEILGYLK
ncbi:MAG: tRNA (adenosine(37)-N6)-dimethylallyltransferase MiaA, partial [Muribaculaceae bacterium]|nr:tRNA (adenosine(37)-N6)-dimethylallyltransferase MiaA [Muribaculaceae bacterium]